MESIAQIFLPYCHMTFKLNYISCEYYMLLEFYWAFSSYTYYRIVVEYVCIHICNVLAHHFQTYLHFLQNVCVGWNLMKGHFSFNIHQGITWWSPYEWLNVYTVEPLKGALRGQRFNDDAGVEAYVRSWLQTRPTSFYDDGISKLPIRWEKCVLKAGEYSPSNWTEKSIW
jgi:hypothetical protein